MALLARLKPYNERKGHLTRTYMIDGARFFVERGWYEVSDALGDKLRDLHQDHYDEDSPKLFDVCSKSQAERLDQQESQVVEVRAPARRPGTVSARSEQAKLINNAGEGEGGDTTTADVARRPAPRSDERQPINNAGEGAGGDTTTADVASKPSAGMLDPDPDGKELADTDEDDGRAVEVGRIPGRSSPPPKNRVKR